MTVEEKNEALKKSEFYKEWSKSFERLSSALRSQNVQLYTPMIADLCAAFAANAALKNIIPHGNLIVNIIRRVGISVVSTMVGATADHMTTRSIRNMIRLYDGLAEKFMKMSKELEDSANKHAELENELQASKTTLLN